MMLGFVFALPFEEVTAAGPMGLPFGGRVVTPVTTGYLWYNGLTPMYCPPHLIIASYGPIKGTPTAVFIPPVNPRANYNYTTPGVAIKGFYYPAPNVILCPFYPVYYSSLFGTSVTP